jgi:hypothetical protein
LPESRERRGSIAIGGVGNCKNLLAIDEKAPASREYELDILDKDEVGVAVGGLPVESEDATK